MSKNKNMKLMNTKRAGAFTLIELLVVIAIIGIIAALVTNLAGKAARTRKINRVRAEVERLETVIDSYQSKLGFYPPDNGNLISDDSTRPSAATNQLFYELAGATFDGTSLFTANGKTISSADVNTYFKREGIANSQDAKKFFAASEAQHKAIAGDVQVLIVPVELQPGQINPWRYDASSTNRHNPESYDIWAEILIGGKTNIIGNWKE